MWHQEIREREVVRLLALSGRAIARMVDWFGVILRRQRLQVRILSGAPSFPITCANGNVGPRAETHQILTIRRSVRACAGEISSSLKSKRGRPPTISWPLRPISCSKRAVTSCRAASSTMASRAKGARSRERSSSTRVSTCGRMTSPHNGPRQD